MEKPIIVITGPTASGKTAISLSVMQKFPAEAICADSMTIYRGMDIGTDKPTLDESCEKVGDHYEIKGVRHHLLDRFDPDQECNVSVFRDLVQYEVDEIHKRGNIPFLVGGSLFYIDAFAYDYSIPKVEPDLKLRKELEARETEDLWTELVALDPDAEWTVDRKNKRRLVRALEVCLKSGKPFSEQKSKKKLKDNILYLAVACDREELYHKINKRVDVMFREGFVDEVRELYEKYDGNTAMQAAGYREIIEYLEGRNSLKKAIENTKRVHRNFAKRQLTWLRRNSDVIWIKNAAEAEKKIKTFLTS
ncbi:MAG: tRNA (adenosine(37)-N6)-dimethylallyltransferase MiaA [Patescibacteria group bacterium]|nr:tRNA (adenosine(37)-N6)-dimethylallyltransferase MiaA [Patescibacteria group bacterium]